MPRERVTDELLDYVLDRTYELFPIHAMATEIKERRAAEKASTPVAWMRVGDDESSISTMTHCISTKVKDVWLKANPMQVENYTIPLYAAQTETLGGAVYEAVKAVGK